MLNRRVSCFQCHSIRVHIFGMINGIFTRNLYESICVTNIDDPDMRAEDVIVTASHAIFHTEDKRSAPVAVVGFQFQHSALLTLIKNTTSNVCRWKLLPALGNLISGQLFFLSIPLIVRWQLCELLYHIKWPRSRLLRFRQSWFYYIILESKWYGQIFGRIPRPLDATSHFRKCLRRSKHNRLSSGLPSR